MHNRAATDDLLELVDRFRPDVINSNNVTGFSTEVWRGARTRGVPVVHTIRDDSLVCSRSTLFRNGRDSAQRCAPCWALTNRKRHNSSLVDHVIGISREVLNRHRAHGCFTGTPSEVIHNIAAGDVPATPPELGGPVVFGFLGRIEVEKGIDVLLAASERLGGSPHRVRIGGLGSTEYVEPLRSGHPHAHIEWLGQVDADAFLASIDTLVVPAIWAEPMGRTVIEAAVRGISVIHSDAGGIPEVATLSARRRQVVAGDVAALAAAMADVIARPDEWRQRRPATAAALEPFSSDHVVGRHVDVFERLVAGQS